MFFIWKPDLERGGVAFITASNIHYNLAIMCSGDADDTLLLCGLYAFFPGLASYALYLDLASSKHLKHV